MNNIDDKSHDGFCDRLKGLIGHRGVRYFARKCGISEGALRRYLASGEPTRPVLIKIAEAAEVSLEWLITGNSNMHPSFFDAISGKAAIEMDINKINYDITIEDFPQFPEKPTQEEIQLWLETIIVGYNKRTVNIANKLYKENSIIKQENEDLHNRLKRLEEIVEKIQS